ILVCALAWLVRHRLSIIEFSRRHLAISLVAGLALLAAVAIFGVAAAESSSIATFRDANTRFARFALKPVEEKPAWLESEAAGAAAPDASAKRESDARVAKRAHGE